MGPTEPVDQSDTVYCKMIDLVAGALNALLAVVRPLVFVAGVVAAAGGRAACQGSGEWTARTARLCSYCPFRVACPAWSDREVPVPGSPESTRILERSSELVRRTPAPAESVAIVSGAIEEAAIEEAAIVEAAIGEADE